ncbi:MAG: hypothetical protein KJ941_00075 [Bacteroidetes bacterium]|nr:hypothetical protein [Bacteroidota bacterium]
MNQQQEAPKLIINENDLIEACKYYETRKKDTGFLTLRDYYIYKLIAHNKYFNQGDPQHEDGGATL